MAEKQRIVNTPDGPQAFPPDATDAEISAALNARPASKVPKQLHQKLRTWTDTAVDALPAIGGVVGGTLGAMTGIPTAGLTSLPAAVTGAAILGAGGEALKQGINRMRGVEVPATPTDAALDIGKQALIQGGTTAAVGGVVKGAQVAAPYAMKGIAAVADSVNPDLVGLVSPRLANAFRIAQKAVDVAKESQPKISLKAIDVVRIKSLMEQGISQGEATKSVLMLKAKGIL